ncbi:MAG: signal transduction histidine kinase/ligand-binding sensor domain-containing protein [Cyclobacteriaceae bacterium]|jgi:signal transduction histidine kinase/ligand-binding sensor domain-containing protein/DNA-binding response OmpR family regulator
MLTILHLRWFIIRLVVKHRNVNLAILLLYLLPGIDIEAQNFNNKNYNITYIDVSSGLSNNYVRNVIEDGFGFKWIATEGGLNRYDGKSFQVFKPGNTPELANENIEVVYEDKDGNLWIGTKSGGLTYYDSRKEQFYNYNQNVFSSLPNGSARVTTIVEDAQNRMFIGTWSHGLFVFNKDSSGSVEHFLANHKINKVQSDKYGNVWIAEGNSLIKYDPSEDRLIKLGDYGLITAICSDTLRNWLWLGINQKGVGYLDLDDYSYHRSEFFFDTAGNAESLAVDNEGRLFVGTWGQGLHISDANAQNFKKFSLLPSAQEFNNASYEAILNIHLDKNGIIWISTAFGGIVKLMPVNNFEGLAEFLPNKKLADNNIYALSSDSEGKVWMGSYGEGVTVVLDNNLINLNNIPASKINVFLEVANSMLIGTREGLFEVDVHSPNQKFSRLFSGLSKITALHHSKNGRLWIGTQQNGLYHIDHFLDKDPSSELVKAIKWVGGDRISKLTEDRHGNIWIGTFNGLFIYDQKNDRYVSGVSLLTKKLPSDIINDMFLDVDQDKLWVALSGGLVELDLDGVSIRKYTVNGINQGLKNEFITSVIKSSDNQIWVGTAYGLAKYLPERQVFENYGNSEGVPVHSFNIKSVTQNRKGELLFGATNGITVFHPDVITYRQADPEVLFTGLSINGSSINVGEEINGNIILKEALPYTSDIELTYQDETFSFIVSTLDYLGDYNVLFSYRLIGFNDKWSQLSSNREIRYINLNPGNYRLEVRASRDSFHWSNVAFKNIKIAPPPWATWYAYTFYLCFLVALAYLINFIAKKQANLKANLEIERIAREKEHDLSEAKIIFFTNISHEFRTPLTLILSPIIELIMDQNIKGKIRERLNIVEKNASRLLQLINQLLDFRKSENGLLQMRVAQGDFVSFSKEIFLSFKGLAESKNIQYSFSHNPKRIVLPFDRDKMEIVLVNLLSNAFKYTPVDGKIKFDVEELGKYCHIKIEDSGIGINQKDLEKIFDRFYQIQTTETAKIVGSGIGLSLAKNIVILHHGEITVSSIPKKETTFTIQIPIDNPLFVAGEYISDFKGSDDKSYYSELDKEEVMVDLSLKKDDRETVLVVDDNDEIRNYLSTLLREEEYDVITASNGVEGLQLANEAQPDLIISDIMMPEMDGITLCSTLKNDLNTSHIPVILLTARTSTVFEVSGLQTGADDYIKKPFHPAVVLTRVSGLLENRRKLRQYFVNKLRFEPSDQIEAPGTEEKFIQKAITTIEDHIQDSEFGIENLMDVLAMSKSTLYRKLKSLTGLSITAFIRSVKLKKAAELILSVDWKLNQIAYESGFNDYKYFKTCFQEQFGCLPSEYRSKKTISS